MKNLSKYLPEISILAFVLAAYTSHSIYIGSQLFNFATDEISIVHAFSFPITEQVFSSWDPLGSLRLLRYYTYPPIGFFFGYLTTLLLGRSWMLMTLVQNTFYFTLMLVSTYLLAKGAKDRVAGILSALILALSPNVYGVSTSFVLDFYSMAMMPVTIYCLLKSGMFRDIKWSILFAIALGCAMMNKDTIVIFILGPAIFAFFNALKAAFRRDFVPLRNFGIFMVITAIMMAPFYFRLERLDLLLSGPLREASSIRWYSEKNLNFFLMGIYRNQLTPPFFLALIIGIYFFFRREVSPELKWLALLWIIVPNLILLFSPHWKTSRYLMPVLPAYAIIGAVGMSSISKKWQGKAVIALIFTMAITAYPSLTYSKGLHLATGGEYSCGASVYYGYNDATLPFPERLARSDILSGMYGGLTKRIRNDGRRGLVRISSPYQDLSMLFYRLQNAYFWFQRSRDTNIVFSQYYGMLSNSLEIEDLMDYIIFAISEKDDTNNLGYDLPFDYVEKKIYENQKNGGKPLTEGQWEIARRKWDRARRVFSVHEKIYEGDGFRIYLYSRKK